MESVAHAQRTRADEHIRQVLVVHVVLDDAGTHGRHDAAADARGSGDNGVVAGKDGKIRDRGTANQRETTGEGNTVMKDLK